MAKPQKCITVQQAETLYSNWQSTRGVSLTSLNGPDTSDFTFSLAEMQEFLDYVKSKSEEQNISDPGIRIYFAAYSGSNDDKATVFLAPTKGSNANSDNNYNVDPLNTVTGGWPPNAYNE